MSFSSEDACACILDGTRTFLSSPDDVEWQYCELLTPLTGDDLEPLRDDRYFTFEGSL